jgi:hypothetical protein
MSDLTRTRRTAGHGRTVLEFTPLRKWPADSAIIMSSAATYLAAEGNDMAGTLCAVCLDPLDIAPFSVHAAVYPGPCERENSHMPALAIAIHSSCEIPGDTELCALIIAMSATCAPR